MILIEIPFFISPSKMQDFIINEYFAITGINLDVPVIDYKAFKVGSSSELEIIKKMVIEKNGVCLSDNYIKATEPLRFKCNECGIIWSIKICNVLNSVYFR